MKIVRVETRCRRKPRAFLVEILFVGELLVDGRHFAWFSPLQQGCDRLADAEVFPTMDACKMALWGFGDGWRARPFEQEEYKLLVIEESLQRHASRRCGLTQVEAIQI